MGSACCLPFQTGKELKVFCNNLVSHRKKEIKGGTSTLPHTSLLLSYSVTAIREKMYKFERNNTAFFAQICSNFSSGNCSREEA